MAKKPSNAIVVYKSPPPQGRQNKNKNQKKKKNKAKATPNGAIAAYKAALMDPFSTTSMGARVPDMFSAPTAPKHISTSFTMATNALGEADLIVLPNLYMQWVSPRGSLAGGTWVTMDGVTKGTCNVMTGLIAHLVNYRIVGYGVRLYTTSSITSTSGRLLAATSPVSSWVNYKAAPIGGQTSSSNNASASANNTIGSYGFPATNSEVMVSALPRMLNCLETSLTSLASRPVIVTPKITSPEAFEFRQAGDSSIGFQINNQTSASYVSSGDASYLRVAGHEAVAVCITGAPASVPCVQVEIVYHVEGMPTFDVVSGDAPQNISAPVEMAKIVAEAARSEPFKQGIEMAGNVVYPGLGTFARNLF